MVFFAAVGNLFLSLEYLSRMAARMRLPSAVLWFLGNAAILCLTVDSSFFWLAANVFSFSLRTFIYAFFLSASCFFATASKDVFLAAPFFLESASSILRIVRFNSSSSRLPPPAAPAPAPLAAELLDAPPPPATITGAAYC